MTGSLNNYSLVYDGAYRTTAVTDGNGHTTSYQFSTAGYLSEVIYPTGEFTQALSWDHNGNVLTAQNGRGQAMNFGYADNESRLTQVQSGTVNDAFNYDGYGRLHGLSDVTGARTFTYDDDDLLVGKILNYSGLPVNVSNFDFTYGYNHDGSRSSLGLTNSGTGLNLNFSYGYNGRGDLTGLTNPYNETFTWSYLDNGWLSTQQSANAAITSFSYNALGQLLDLSNKTIGNTVLSDFNMSGSGHYDGAGNLLGLTASLPNAPASYSGTTTLQYDGHDQLTSEQSTRLGSYTNQFAFDGAGNPTTFKGVAQTFNSSNQNTAIGYDHDGNPTSWQGNALGFDVANHLTNIGTLVTAGYNAEGLRGWKQSASGTTYFLYDGLTPIAETDGNGNVTAVNTWGVNGLASRRSVSTNSSVFYTFDEQGSTAQRLDSSGNILGSYGFDAYGTRASTDNSSDPYSGFGAQWGYYRDSETGLSLLGHRYYDPGQGRFLNRDPIGYDGGLNLYAYVGNRPLRFIDPVGWESEFWDGEGTGFDPHAFGGIPEAGAIPAAGIDGEIGGLGGSAEACPSEAVASEPVSEPVESNAEAPKEYYRAVGDAEANAIKQAGQAVPSQSAKFGANDTRIFASSAMNYMRGYFNYANSQLPGTYTHMVTFYTSGSLSLLQESPVESYLVNVTQLNGALTRPPGVSPINFIIAGDSPDPF